MNFREITGKLTSNSLALLEIALARSENLCSLLEVIHLAKRTAKALD